MCARDYCHAHLVLIHSLYWIDSKQSRKVRDTVSVHQVCAAGMMWTCCVQSRSMRLADVTDIIKGKEVSSETIAVGTNHHSALQTPTFDRFVAKVCACAG